METTFTPNCISGPSQGTRTGEAPHAAELRSLFTTTQEALQTSESSNVLSVRSGNEIARFVATVSVNETLVKIALLNPNKEDNREICAELLLDATLAHIILSHEVGARQFNTAISFDPQVNFFTPADSASFYATVLDNHWIAASDVELDATQWATRALTALLESTKTESGSAEDFSAMEFTGGQVVKA